MCLHRYFIGTGAKSEFKEEEGYKNDVMFIDKLNPDNNMASVANEVTIQFSKFMNAMWYKNSGSGYAPRDLKKAIGRKNCLFEGFS